MKVMICENCENTISEDYLETVVDVSVNEDGIKTYYEHPQRCQCCGGIYVEAETCFVCGNYKRPTDLIEGVCADCLCENANLENAIKFGDFISDENVNDFAVYLLGMKKINEILADYIKLNKLPKDEKLATVYCLEKDRCRDFTEFLKGEN